MIVKNTSFLMKKLLKSKIFKFSFKTRMDIVKKIRGVIAINW